MGARIVSPLYLKVPVCRLKQLRIKLFQEKIASILNIPKNCLVIPEDYNVTTIYILLSFEILVALLRTPVRSSVLAWHCWEVWPRGKAWVPGDMSWKGLWNPGLLYSLAMRVFLP